MSFYLLVAQVSAVVQVIADVKALICQGDLRRLRPLLQLLKEQGVEAISILYHQSHLLIKLTEIIAPTALVGVLRALLDDLFHRLFQNGIDHRSRAGQIDEVFARVISENAICAALSQNENTPIDPFAVLLIIERLCIPG